MTATLSAETDTLDAATSEPDHLAERRHDDGSYFFAQPSLFRRCCLWVLYVFGGIVLAMHISLAVLAVSMSVLSSGPDVIVAGGSMRPGINPGDLVINNAPDPDQIHAGRVVLFQIDERLVTHRIMKPVDFSDESAGWVTRGDALPENDSSPLPEENIRGIGRAVVPFVGLPARYLETQSWSSLMTWVGVVLLAVSFRRIDLDSTHPDLFFKVVE